METGKGLYHMNRNHGGILVYEVGARANLLAWAADFLLLLFFDFFFFSFGGQDHGHDTWNGWADGWLACLVVTVVMSK
jgi:hypothetical protein